MSTSYDDIVVTGIGVVSSRGLNADQIFCEAELTKQKEKIEDYKVPFFSPLPFFSDKKVIKAIAPRDVLGLVAFEESIKSSQIDRTKLSPERIGVFVGASPSLVPDNKNYDESVLASKENDGFSTKLFGTHYRNANPTTLLQGLPNNVLCYGSKSLDARGPNSNYTALEMSSHQALNGALRAFRRGRLDMAVVGGYSAYSDPVSVAMYKQRGLLADFEMLEGCKISSFANATGTIPAEGAVFLTLERESQAFKRDAKPIAKIRALEIGFEPSVGQKFKVSESTLVSLIRRVLSSAKIGLSDLDFWCLSGFGFSNVSEFEASVVRELLSPERSDTVPILLSLAPYMGNLFEASGLLEIEFMRRLYLGEVDCSPFQLSSETFEPMRGDKVTTGSSRVFKGPAQFSLVTQVTHEGHASAMLLEFPG
jgi:3-oxoacyl-(acyl-carrier-protein) synthase